jgi:hypothetical protein
MAFEGYTILRELHTSKRTQVYLGRGDATQKGPKDRTEVLSSLVEDLRCPNAALGYDRPRPLMERNPLAVWRALALALALAMSAINIVLLALLAR